jgi:hypothetical protein
LKISLK